MKERLQFKELAPEGYRTLLDLERFIQQGVDHTLLHLVKLRASQINRCAYCIDMHTKEALKDGERPQRLYLLTAWRESSLYSAKEKAALAWTEAVTLIAEAGAPDDIYEELQRHFPETEIVNLTLAIGAINVWNRLAISFHTPHPVDH